MYTSIHLKFIETPLLDILKDAVNACDGVGSNIETYPLCDYVMQSIFLRMTGAQEQKLKCICWELATNNFSYRYRYLKEVKNDYGEFSKYEQKNKVYNELLREILRKNPDFLINKYEWIVGITESVRQRYLQDEINEQIQLEIEKQKSKGNILNDQAVLNIEKNVTERYSDQNKQEELLFKAKKKHFLLEVKSKFQKVLNNSTLSVSNWRGYTFWSMDKEMISDQYALSGNLLGGKLKLLYEDDVIQHRHRCAHNLTSYQQNLPTLSTLSDSKYKSCNYFFRFYILILIDEVFIRLYREYIKALDDKII